MINFTTMILAAGFGTRMQRLTNNTPKPLLKLNNKSLLSNSIDFFEKLGCDKFVINTHYLHEQFKKYIKLYHSNKNIKLIYEPEILGTGGGIKNAINYFENKNFVVANSDILWKDDNVKDIKSFLSGINNVKFCKLLISNKQNSIGLNKDFGDFIIENNYLRRWKKNDQIFFYSGLQIVNPVIFNNIYQNKFSINQIWENLINKKKISGFLMESKFFHIGDINTFLKIKNDLLLD